MSYIALTVRYEADLAILTFNRPEKRNAVSPEMIVELLTALDEIEHSQVRVGILTGAGKTFCSGMDLDALKDLAAQARNTAVSTEAEVQAPATAGLMDVAVRVLKGQVEERAPLSPMTEPTELALESSRTMARMFRRIYDFPKPLIAAVNGAAIAGGCGIATLCDFTLAVPEAKFGYTEVRIGFVPAIVSVFLIRQIGEKRARDLLLTGRIIDAEEAYRLGLASEIVTPERLMDRTRELAGQLLENSPTSLSFTKQVLTNLSQHDIDRGLELAIEANAGIRSTPDFREGVSAFLEKRKPVWHSK
ncbi:MAG TPA: enoyl-CoA hydratase/isomerase family protein [Terriglobia bacterium]|nr:enoyl-CoA hydratase/isomerase family protein [Terriglobia bacterium]